MTTSVTLLLDIRRAKANNTFPLIIRIIHNRTIAQITLGIYLTKKDWNEEKLIIKPSYQDTNSVTRLNHQIRTKKNDIADFVNKLDETKKLANIKTANEIKELFEKKTEYISFYKYTEILIAEMEKAHRIGNARIYKTVSGVLKTYCNDKDISFQEITHAFLIRFETDHYAKGNKTNSLATYFRTLRAIYNRAIKDGVVEKELYPFNDYKIKSTKTNKRAINITAINKIEKLLFKPNHPLYHAHNYFLFSYYCRGMPFADMAHLKIENIIDGRIKFNRQKNDKAYDIKIIEEVQSILDKYVTDKKSDNYIFPIIDRTTPKEIYKDVEWARKRYNKKLKDIATLCEISENLTSYVSRHSFASRAKNLNIPVANISDMLGHDSIKTTQIYMDSLPSDLMDADHEQIIRGNQKKPVKRTTKKVSKKK